MNIYKFLKKYYNYIQIILFSVVSFHLGCGFAVNWAKFDCDTENNIVRLDSYLQTSFGGIEYAVLVLTGPDNTDKRDVIRQTWMKLSNNINIKNKPYRSGYVEHKPQYLKIFFAVGTQGLDKKKLHDLSLEDTKNKDILFLQDLQDSYKNLTLKLLNSLKWLNENLPKLKYVVKCDDDSFVRLDLIVKEIENYAPEMSAAEISSYVTHQESLPSYSGLYWGYFFGKATVFRSGKWKEPNWFLCDTYLPYALGGGYVISRSIVDYISRNHDDLVTYNSEDVSMGVWTAALKGINRVHDVRFDTQWRSRGCLNSMLIRHKQTPQDMLDMYSILTETNGIKLCKNEAIKFRQYSYNWNEKPSMCCT
ncbi:unnamed protein product [Plutella xylostella]|uniref:Hexosyltransferase n=1 Tax=Plutella xylostella TaxID=51655 RepID=A0A8S4E632_PLUXY|nr:unnamed protein product [Plutella xylostella]